MQLPNINHTFSIPRPKQGGGSRGGHSILIILIFCLYFLSSPVQAVTGVNNFLTFQGKVVNTDGTNVTDGVYDFVFTIYDSAASSGTSQFTEAWTNAALFTSTMTTAPSANGESLVYTSNTNESSLRVGQILWNITRGEAVTITSVNTGSNTLGISPARQAWNTSDTITNRIYVKDGIFRVALNSLNQSSTFATIFSDDTRFLGINFNSDGEMKPRVRLTATPYAMNAASLGSVDASGYLRSNTSDNYTSGTLAFDSGTTVDINGDLSIADTNIAFDGASTTFTTTGAFTLNTGGTITLGDGGDNIVINSNNWDVSATGVITSATWNGTAIGTQYGGTGQNWSAIAQGNIPYFSGTGTMSTLAPSTAGYVLTTNGAGANPSWVDPTTFTGGTNLWQLTTNAISPINSTYALNVGNTASTSAYFHVPGTNNQNAWFNLGTGNLGIGTTNPTAKLYVSGNTILDTLDAGQIHIGDYEPSGFGILFTINADDPFEAFKFKNGDIITINESTTTNRISYYGNSFFNSGNLGIGTTNPGSSLEVAGTIIATGINGFIFSPYQITAPRGFVGMGTGILNSVGTTATGSYPHGVAVDPTGRFVYVTNALSNTVQAYTINPSTSALTSVGTTATGTNPYGAAVDPTGRFVYVTNYGSGTIQAYTINQSTGALTSVGTTATGTNPYNVAVDPTGRFVYVTNYESTTIQVYAINPSTGTTTLVDTVTGTNPYNVAVDPTGRFVYVTNYGSGTIQAYTINQSTGALTSVGTTATGTNPYNVAVDPTGRFVYVTNYESTTIQVYAINPSTGTTTLVDTVTGTNPYNVAVDPTGRFVYVTNYGSDTIQAYTINQSTGALTSVGTTATGTNPNGVAVDPTGRFAYVTNYGSGTIQAYTINQSTGALTSVGTTATGTNPYNVAVDPTGRFVYVTNAGSATVQAYTINNFSAGSAYFAGNVGIGNTNPATFKLEIAGSIGPSTDNTYDLGSDTRRFRDLYLGPNTLHLGTSTTDEYTITYNTTNNFLGFNVNGVGDPEIIFNSTGNVGIGITNPTNKLHIQGTDGSSAGIYLNSAVPSATSYTLYNNAGTLMWNGTALTSLTGTTNYLSKFTSSSALGNSNIYEDATGNIGIGTTAPNGKLSVENIFQYGSTSMNTPNNGSSNRRRLDLGNLSLSAYYPGVSTNTFYNGTNNVYISNDAAFGMWQDMSFNKFHFTYAPAGTAGNTLNWNYGLTIDATTGNIGIGTTNPSARLDIAGNASASGSLVLRSNTLNKFNVLNGGNFIINTSVGGDTGLTERLTMLNNGYVGIGTTKPLAIFDVQENISSAYVPYSSSAVFPDGPKLRILNQYNTSNTGAYIVWQALDGLGLNNQWFAGVGGSGYPFTGSFVIGNRTGSPSYSERFRITSGGTVGIATTYPDQGKIEVKGDTVCVDTNSDNNATSCIANESDIRLKTNVAPIGSALDKIISLTGVEFDWRVNDPDIVAQHPLITRFADRPHSIGLIAQDVEKVFPEAIMEEIDGFKQLNYQLLVSPIIQAIKELNTKVETKNTTQTVALADLQTQLNELSAKVVIQPTPTPTLIPTPNPLVTDVATLSARLAYLENRVTGTIAPTPVPIATVAGTIDIAPVETRITNLESTIASLSASIDLTLQLTASQSALIDALSTTPIATASSVANDINLDVQSIFISDFLSVMGDTVLTNATITHTLTLNSITAPDGHIDLLAGLMTLDATGNLVIINGDVAVTGNLTVLGNTHLNQAQVNQLTFVSTASDAAIASAAASLTADTTGLRLNLTATDAAFRIADSAAISASGSAKFAELAADSLRIDAETATPAATANGPLLTTTASAGTTQIPMGYSHVTINNPKITPRTLIYVTPLSSTNNRTLYVKLQTDGQVVIGFDTPNTAPVSFNWWLVEPS